MGIRGDEKEDITDHVRFIKLFRSPDKNVLAMFSAAQEDVMLPYLRFTIITYNDHRLPE